MNTTDQQRLRADLVASVPEAGLRVRFHGSPANAPSMSNTEVGYLAFRTWSRVYVSVHPKRPLTPLEGDALLEAISRWDSGHGFTQMAGPKGWPSE